MSGLVADTQGNLYGTTVEGGSFNEDCRGSGCGVVFKLSLASGKWAETVLFSFDDADGALPWSSLILDGSGGSVRNHDFRRDRIVYEWKRQRLRHRLRDHAVIRADAANFC